LRIPDDLAETEIGNLDEADSTGALALDELSLISLVFIVWSPWLWVASRDEWCGIEQEVLGLDVSVI
jgi:hypothetical protein